MRYDPFKSLEHAQNKIAARSNRKKANELKKKLKNKIKVQINRKTSVYLDQVKYNQYKKQAETNNKTIAEIFNETYNTINHQVKIREDTKQYLKELLIKYNLTIKKVRESNIKKNKEEYFKSSMLLKELKQNTTMTNSEITSKFKISPAKTHRLLYKIRNDRNNI